MAEQRSFVDYRQGGDSGNDNVDSIQPIQDGEAATQTVFRRPAENTRGRTEVVRETLRELLYHRDYGDLKVSHAAASTVGWGGSTTSGGTGIVTQTGAITIRPMLSPTASRKGTLAVGTAGVNRVTYTVSATGYATQELDLLTVEHRDGGVATALTVSISDGPVKRILVIFDAANVAHTSAAVIAALTPVIAADAVLVGKLTLTNGGIAGNAVAAVIETRVEGTIDQQAHVLATGLLTAYTSGNPLAEGDCVAIWYRYLVEFPATGVAGGKWESNPDRATSNIPIGSLFVTNDSPEKIPGALPICKVVDGDLVFIDGSRFPSGAVGRLGTTDSAYVTTSLADFHGNDTAVANGGISDAITPATVYNVLVDIDEKLTRRRTFTYAITDETASFGGSFGGPTALQDAITALGGTPGTIYLRRGTYTLPDTYVIPLGVSLIGEALTLVTINQAVPTALTNTGLNRIENLTFSIGTIQMSMGTGTTLSNVAITGRATFATNNTASYLTVGNPAAVSTTAFTVTGNANAFTNLTVAGAGLVSGANNTFTDITLTLSGTTPASHLFSITGSYNDLRGVRCVTQSVNLTVSTAMMSVTGAFNSLNTVNLTSTTSSITDGRYGLIVGGDNIALSDVHVLMDLGCALLLTGSTVSGTAKNCTFRNNSTTDNTVIDFMTTQPHRLQFMNCVFDQNEQTGHALWEMFTLLAASTVDDNVLFENCVFYAARLSNFAFKAAWSTFYSCQFVIKNPDTGGFRPLGGVFNAQSNELFQFANRCVLRDCIINGYDAEVNNNAGNPHIQCPLFVKLTNSKAFNLSLINVNRQVYAPTVFYGYINLSTGAVLDGLTLEHTATASVQGGTQRLEAIVNLSGEDASFERFTSALTNWPGTVFPAIVHQLVTATRFTMRDMRLSNDYKSFLTQETAVTLSYSRFDTMVMGVSATSGATSLNGVTFPQGTSNKYSNSIFWVDNAVGAGFMYLPDAQDNHNFENLTFEMNAVVNDTRGVVVGNGNTAVRLKFVGCQWFALASAALTKPFGTSITFSAVAGNICVGAGNTWTYSGGTAGAPTFAANINTW